MEVRLDGRTALITGGSLGLGKAMAMMFAESGAKVAIVARRQDVLDETKKEIEDATGGTVGAYSCNVLEKSEIEAAHAAAVKDLGPIDISGEQCRHLETLALHGAFRRRLGARHHLEAVLEHPLQSPLHSAYEGTEMGPDHQLVEYRRQSDTGGRRANGHQPGGGHVADQGDGKRVRASQHSGQRLDGRADRQRPMGPAP